MYYVGNKRFVVGKFPLSTIFSPEDGENTYKSMYELGSHHTNQDTRLDSERVSFMCLVGSTIYCSGTHLQDQNNQMLLRLNTT